MKKELKRFFTDKRLLLTLLLPGLVIFAVYSVMGEVIKSAVIPAEDRVYKVLAVNAPDGLGDKLKTTGLNIELEEATDEAKTQVKDGVADIFLEYEENFEEKLSALQKPFVHIWYDGTDTASLTAYQAVYSRIYADSVNIEVNYLVNADGGKYDLSTEADMSATFMTTIVPLLLVIMLFTGAMAVATESIAGEKERGTIATLLITPVKRSYIALGKIAALSLTALVSSASSFIGIMASLPKLMSVSGEAEMDFGIYGIATFAEIFLIIVATVILFTVLLSIISALSKSVKEAQQMALPLMLVVMLAGMTTVLGGTNGNLWAYLIPVYNSVQCVAGALSMSASPLNFILTIVSDAAYIALGVFALAKLFNSEKIIFNQ
ncbi:MAG: ABC transporter permease [Clostridia bacterium]|nr:ABC transporter permease [Clostridia bacterium]